MASRESRDAQDGTTLEGMFSRDSQREVRQRTSGPRGWLWNCVFVVDGLYFGALLSFFLVFGPLGLKASAVGWTIVGAGAVLGALGMTKLWRLSIAGEVALERRLGMALAGGLMGAVAGGYLGWYIFYKWGLGRYGLYAAIIGAVVVGLASGMLGRQSQQGQSILQKKVERMYDRFDDEN